MLQCRGGQADRELQFVLLLDIREREEGEATTCSSSRSLLSSFFKKFLKLAVRAVVVLPLDTALFGLAIAPAVVQQAAQQSVRSMQQISILRV